MSIRSIHPAYFGRLVRGIHLSIFFTLPISERCRNIKVVWSTFILVASSLIDIVGFVSTNAFRASFFTDVLGLPCGSFCREKSPDRNLSNQRCTFRSLTVFSPNAWFILRAAFAALLPSLYSYKKITWISVEFISLRNSKQITKWNTFEKIFFVEMWLWQWTIRL